MHVLHVISSIDARSGGPPRALVGLASAQVEAGLEVAVAATHASDADLSLAEAMRRAGVDVHLIGPCRGPLARHRDIRPTLAPLMSAAEVVHVHALWEEIQHQAARLARRRGVPYVIRPCGMLDPWSLAQSRLKKQLYLAWRLRGHLNHAAALHFTTSAERDAAAPLGLSPPAVIEPNGINLQEFEQLPERGAFRQSHDIPASRPLVLFLSRVHPKKGLDLLLPAFAQARLPEAMLVIAGPGEKGYVDQLRTLTKAHGVADRVLFTGMLHGRDRFAALADADLFALTSRQENFGIAVVEALAVGTPVLISDQVNIADQITRTAVGEAVPLEVCAIASAIRRWMTDPSLRRAASEKSRPFVSQHYDWRQIATRWAEHYRALAWACPGTISIAG